MNPFYGLSDALSGAVGVPSDALTDSSPPVNHT